LFIKQEITKTDPVAVPECSRLVLNPVSSGQLSDQHYHSSLEAYTPLQPLLKSSHFILITKRSMSSK
jgi:hypothetical protein